MNATIRTSGFTEGFSLGVAHEWQPGRLLMFAYTAYLDESGTHEGSATTVMGGLLARADHWKAFETTFEKIQRQHGFRVFHTKKFKRKTGDFKGWTNQQCLALIADLGQLTGFGLSGFTCSLNNGLYREVYRRPDLRNVRGRFDSKYGLCFRQCLYHFIVETAKRKHRGKLPQLDVILEDGHTNAGDALRIFREIKSKYAGRGGEMLGRLAFADKDTSGQLMMADFAAHMEMLTDRKVLAGQHVRTSTPIPKGYSGISHHEYTAEALARLRAEALRGPKPASDAFGKQSS